jgi:hypothetical protein
LTDTGLRVQVDVYEDAMLVHPNQVTLGSAASRALYLKHAIVQVPGLDEQILAGRLVQLLPKVEAALKLQMAAPAPPAPAQRSEDELLALCGDLAKAANLLERINKTIGQLGVVGEESVRQLLYLAATARLLSLSDMINVQGDGPSSAGKTWTFRRVIKMLPEDACHDFTRISPQYLAYMQASLEHKMVFIQEIDTLANDDTTVQMVRSLLSEGYVKVGTVDHDVSGARVGRDIVKPGPTQLFTTSAGHKRSTNGVATMPRVCSICVQPQRAAIDQALVAGSAKRDVSALFRFSEDAVTRHAAAHLPKALARAHEEGEAARADDLLAEARRLKEITIGLLGRAVQANDLRTALVAVREARGNLEFIGKLLGDLDSGPAVNVLLAPEWVSVRATLLAALALYPDARTAVAAQLMALELEAPNGHRG